MRRKSFSYRKCISKMGESTANNKQVATNCVDILQQACYNKPISGCVRMACNSLLATSVLQVECQNLLCLLKVVVYLRPKLYLL